MTPSARPPLSRDRIVAAAVQIADAQGVQALSMRKLATHLEFEVMSLYNHVANKGDLLDAMVDLVAGEIAAPPLDMDWKPALRSVALSAHDALLTHRWASPFWSSRWPGPNRWRHMENLLEVLGTAGLPDDLADLGFHAITLHIHGFTQQQLNYADNELLEDTWYERFTADVDAAAHPNVHAHIEYHVENERGHDGFEFVLDLILDGLERLANTG